MSYESMKDHFQEITRLRIDFLNFYHLSNYLILPLTKPGASNLKNKGPRWLSIGCALNKIYILADAYPVTTSPIFPPGLDAVRLWR